MTGTQDSASGGWIEWAGGECPVDLDTFVQVHFSTETRREAAQFPPRRARYRRWEHKRGRVNIIAYRIVPGGSADV